MELQKYKIDILNYTADNSVKSNCGDITFYNVGVVPVTINSALRLVTGGSVAIQANAGEEDVTIYNFQFDNSVLAKSLVVLRKIYVNA